MSDGVRADIIYFNTSSDWLFESELYSKYYSLRLLTATASSKLEAIKALGRALSRSETVIVVGGWQGETYLPATIAKAVGLSCQRVGLPGSAPEDAVLLPSGAIPLTADGQIRGAILCRGPQAIVMVDDAREGRVRLAKDFIAPYLIKQAGLVSDPKPVGKAETAQETVAEKPKAVESQSVVEAETVAERAPEKPAQKGTEPSKKPSVEEIPMERVRLVLPKKKTVSTGLPELKFGNGIKPVERAKPQAAEKQSAVEEIAVESANPAEKKPEKKPEKEPEKKAEPVKAESPVEPKPKKAKSVEEIPALPTEKPAKKEKTVTPKPEKPAAEKPKKEKSAEQKPAKKEKSAQAKPLKSKPEPIKPKKAVVEQQTVSPEQVDEVENIDEGIELPKFGRVLTIICIIVILLSLAAALYIGYETFVQGSVGDASAVSDVLKGINL